MIYRYIGTRGICISQGIGVKQYEKGELVETKATVEQLGLNPDDFELIPLNGEAAANKQRQDAIEFRLQNLIKEKDKFMSEQELKLKDINSEIDSVKSELDAFIKEHTVQPKAEKKSKIKEE
jgi:hypothetical protein